MKKIILEVATLLVVVAIAVGLMLAFTMNVDATPVYTQMAGRVVTIPVDVSSPVYGQIVALNVMPGERIRQGQPLATINMLDPLHANVPQSPLYKPLTHNRLQIESPATGVVSQVNFADLSTIGVASNLAQIFTVTDTQVQVYVPRGTNLSAYTAFYAADYATGPRYPIKLVSRMPQTGADPTRQNMDVYAASFTHPSDASDMLSSVNITVLAREPAKRNHYLPVPKFNTPSLPSLPNIHLP